MRIFSSFCAVLALAGATPLAAAPLTFGAINGTEDLSQGPHGACTPSPDGEGSACLLARTSFGGLPITRGTMALNAEGRVRAVEIQLDADDHELVGQLLAGRYGAPDVDGPTPEWRSFDDGARVLLSRDSEGTRVTLEYPANDIAAVADGPSSTLFASLLGFLVLGIGAGVAVGRLRRGRKLQPAMAGGMTDQPVSMRVTLEQRMRDGRGLEIL